MPKPIVSTLLPFPLGFRGVLPVWAVLVLVTQLSAQKLVSENSSQISAWPRPYAFGGLSLNVGGGYSPSAASGGTGVELDGRNVIGLAEISADNAHKKDSGTGYDVRTMGRIFFRIQDGWYVGAGAQWNKLLTKDYTKQAWRPTFGGGKDFKLDNFSMRTQVMYVLPGTDHLNAVQGPEIALWIPSPATKRHWFWRETIGIYQFHQTSLPGNSGTQDKSITSSVDFTVMYRF